MSMPISNIKRGREKKIAEKRVGDNQYQLPQDSADNIYQKIHIPRIATNPKLILNKTMTNGDVDCELMATTATSIMRAYPFPFSHL